MRGVKRFAVFTIATLLSISASGTKNQAKAESRALHDVYAGAVTATDQRENDTTFRPIPAKQPEKQTEKKQPLKTQSEPQKKKPGVKSSTLLKMRQQNERAVEVDRLKSVLEDQRKRARQMRDKMVANPVVIEKASSDAYDLFQNRLSQVGMGMALLDPPKNKNGAVDEVFLKQRNNPNSSEIRGEAAKTLLLRSFDRNQAADLAFALLSAELNLTPTDLSKLDAPLIVAGAGIGVNTLAKNQKTFGFTRVLKKPGQTKGLGLTFTNRSRELGFGFNPISNGNLSASYLVSPGKTVKLDAGYADVNKTLAGHYEASAAVAIKDAEVGTKVFHEPLRKGASLSAKQGQVSTGLDVITGAPDAETRTTDIVAAAGIGSAGASLRKSSWRHPQVVITTNEAGLRKGWQVDSNTGVNVSVSGATVATTQMETQERTETVSGTVGATVSRHMTDKYAFDASSSITALSDCSLPVAQVSVQITDTNRDVRAILAAGYDPVGNGDNLKLMVSGPMGTNEKKNDVRKQVTLMITKINESIAEIDVLVTEREKAKEHKRSFDEMIQQTRERLGLYLSKLDKLPDGSHLLDPNVRKRVRKELTNLEVASVNFRKTPQ